MSKAGCYQAQNDASGSCSERFEVMEELNSHYSERIKKIEKAGYTELLVVNLKKWIDALVKHDKVLIANIESLENEALKRSDKISELCKDRKNIEDIGQKYKQELCEKTEIIKQLNCKIKDHTDALSQKECLIKRLNGELEQLKNCIEKLQNESNSNCDTDSDMSLAELKCEFENMKKELGYKECQMKRLEKELCLAQKTILGMKETKCADANKDSNQVKELLNQVNCLEAKVNSKDGKLQDLCKRVQDLQAELNCKSKELEGYHSNGIPFIEDDLKQQEKEKAMEEKLEESKMEIGRLQKLLDGVKGAGDSDVQTLRRDLDSFKRESRDMKEALTTEVAEKHDMITTLRRDTAQLEEKARQADMQAIFKDDIIKELRKEVKLARAKLQPENGQDSVLKIQVLDMGNSTKVTLSEESLKVDVITESLLSSSDKIVQTK